MPTFKWKTALAYALTGLVMGIAIGLSIPPLPL